MGQSAGGGGKGQQPPAMNYGGGNYGGLGASSGGKGSQPPNPNYGQLSRPTVQPDMGYGNSGMPPAMSLGGGWGGGWGGGNGGYGGGMGGFKPQQGLAYYSPQNGPIGTPNPVNYGWQAGMRAPAWGQGQGAPASQGGYNGMGNQSWGEGGGKGAQPPQMGGGEQPPAYTQGGGQGGRGSWGGKGARPPWMGGREAVGVTPGDGQLPAAGAGGPVPAGGAGGPPAGTTPTPGQNYGPMTPGGSVATDPNNLIKTFRFGQNANTPEQRNFDHLMQTAGPSAAWQYLLKDMSQGGGTGTNQLHGAFADRGYDQAVASQLINKFNNQGRNYFTDSGVDMISGMSGFDPKTGQYRVGGKYGEAGSGTAYDLIDKTVPEWMKARLARQGG